MLPLNSPYSLTPEQIQFYLTNGFIKIKQLLSADTLAHFDTVVSRPVMALSREAEKLRERDTYGKAFLQLCNLWQKDAEIAQLVFSKRLASIATQLMEVEGVRLYHDQALFKEAGGGITPWHADQYYWPLATDKAITAWIPLQAVPLEMGPLEFSAGSQVMQEGRELEISDESEMKIRERLRVTDFERVVQAFDLGEVSFHAGWVFHRAGANQTEHSRNVLTIIYIDQDMRLKQPENKHQQADWESWCPGVACGEIINSPLNPVLYSLV